MTGEVLKRRPTDGAARFDAALNKGRLSVDFGRRQAHETVERNIAATLSEAHMRVNTEFDERAVRVEKSVLMNLFYEAERDGHLPREVVQTSTGGALLAVKAGEGKYFRDGAFFTGVQAEEGQPPRVGDALDLDDSHTVRGIRRFYEDEYDEGEESRARITSYPGFYPVDISAVYHVVGVPYAHSGGRSREIKVVSKRDQLADTVPYAIVREKRVVSASSPEAAVLSAMSDLAQNGNITTSVEVFTDAAWYDVDLEALEAA